MYRIAIQPIRIEPSLYGGVTFSSSPGYRTSSNWMDYLGAQPRAHPLATGQTMTKLLEASDIIWISRHRGQNHPLGIWRPDPLIETHYWQKNHGSPRGQGKPDEFLLIYCCFHYWAVPGTACWYHLVQRVPRSQRTITVFSSPEEYSFTLNTFLCCYYYVRRQKQCSSQTWYW